MTITPVEIPLTPYSPPPFRLLWRDGFGVDESGTAYGRSSTGWNVLAQPVMDSPHVDFGGVELLYVKLRTLPDVGTAAFRYVSGSFANNKNTTPPELLNMDVRLQVQDGPGKWHTIFWGKVDYFKDEVYQGSPYPQGVRTYYCVDGFARTMKWLMDRHTTDVFNDGTCMLPECYGHPGYNYMNSGDSVLLGNQSNFSTQPRGAGVDVTGHVWAGAHTLSFTATLWTDLRAAEHAAASVRPAGEPWFVVLGPASFNFLSPNPWTVGVNESVHEFCSRVYDRHRGLGTVAVDWVDNVDGSLTVFLQAEPLFNTDQSITVKNQFGSDVTVTLFGVDGGAYRDIAGNPLTLTGDHRNVDGSFELSTAEMQLVDYVETVGEPIEVAVTLSHADTIPSLQAGQTAQNDLSPIYVPNTQNDPSKPQAAGTQISLAPRWSFADVQSFEALPQERRVQAYWDHAYQLQGLPRNWRYTVANSGWGPGGNGIAGAHRTDYRLLDDGTLYAPLMTDYQDTSAVQAEILGTLPFYQGYNYGNPIYPEKTDSTPQQGMPGRRSAQIYMHLTETAEDRWFLPNGELPAVIQDKFNFNDSMGNWNPTLTVYPDAFLVKSDFFTQFGMRAFASNLRDQSLSSGYQLASEYDITALAFTVSIRLPHRLRLCTAATSVPARAHAPGQSNPPVGVQVADWAQAKRRKTIYIPNCHLWLADYNCIWDLDQESDTTAQIQEGYLARRNALQASGAPAVLRSDLPRLALYHLAASGWYLTQRQRVKWAQKTCGFLQFPRLGYPDDTGPGVGSFIDTLNYAGTAYTINTPVTEMDYDHQQGITSWSTDFFDLVFGL